MVIHVESYHRKPMSRFAAFGLRAAVGGKMISIVICLALVAVSMLAASPSFAASQQRHLVPVVDSASSPQSMVAIGHKYDAEACGASGHCGGIASNDVPERYRGFHFLFRIGRLDLITSTRCDRPSHPPPIVAACA
jgi:hypothetical protein